MSENALATEHASEFLDNIHEESVDTHEEGGCCSEERARSRKRKSRSSRHNKRPHTATAEAPSPRFDDLSSNPHILQVVANPDAGHISVCDFPFTRILDDNYPRIPYRRRKNEVKTVIHWGQRKLLMSEIEYLTMFARPGDTVLYAGAAPGTHTQILIDMFPEISFVLVDPAPFSPQLQPSERVALRHECFTDALAAEYRSIGTRLLFISDVRSCDWNGMDQADVEEHVWADMQAQQRWHVALRPRRSMLKFRLPWRPGHSEFLDGDIYLPVWGPVTTSEARLITRENSVALRMYDNTIYEQMYFFNTRARVARYQHGVDTATHVSEGLDYCYDCAAEVSIIAGYYMHGPPSRRGVWALAGDDAAQKELSTAEGREPQAEAGADDVRAEERSLNLAVAPSARSVPRQEDAVPESMLLPLIPADPDLVAKIAKFSQSISLHIGGGRTLQSPNTDPGERVAYLRSRQWIQGAPAYASHLRPVAHDSVAIIAHHAHKDYNDKEPDTVADKKA